MPRAERSLKPAALALAILCPGLAAAPASADGYVLGAGRWTCAEVTEAVDSGNPSRIGQSVGWVFGTWTAATFRRETGFIDTVEQVGGNAIWERTVAECRNAPPETMLYRVVNAMISNTK